MLPKFELIKPQSLQEVVDSLNRWGEDARVLAGGTDVIVQMREGKSKPKYLIDIKGIAELNGIRLVDDALWIGSLTTHRELECSDTVRKKFPLLYDGVSKVGSVQVRNRGTIGGNICSALPSADSAAPLLALDAAVRLYGPEGGRELQLADFFLGPGKTALKVGEILTQIIVKLPVGNSSGAYYKYARREAMDLALLGIAIYLECEDDLSTCREARIALATAAPTPIRAFQAETALKGRLLSETLLEQAGAIASDEARPRTSWRSSADFRKHLVKVLVPRAGMMAWERIKQQEAD
ncbi:hypothetical protein SY88_16645 [Clostridiales bacterium PH28_bin88]|nr:hypothetical protein SY88_16645 [Clostridiales bacterium PH28_bin88]